MNRVSFAFIILLVVCVTSCSKKHDPLDLPSVQQNNKLDTLVSFTANINGAAWHTNSVIANSIFYPTDSGKTNLSVTATRKYHDSTTSITFFINDFKGANTYTINPPAVSAAYYVGTQRHIATSGQIIIASDTLYAIIGTINFVADSFTVSSGVFNVETP